MKYAALLLLAFSSGYVFSDENEEIETKICNVLRQKHGLKKVDSWSKNGCMIAGNSDSGVPKNHEQMTFLIREINACYYHIVVNMKTREIVGSALKSPIEKCESVWDQRFR
jgi:ribosomal protein S15P/S13E